MQKIVVYLSTHHLYDVLPAAYNSLLAHTQVDHVYLLIEHDTLPFKLPANVSCVNVSGQTFFPKDGPNFNSPFTYMAMMKAALTKLFPDIDQLLILDVDTIVREDISSLWDIDLSDHYFAAVREPKMSDKLGYKYANFGVVMMNLKLLRETGMDDRVIHEINTVRHQCPEQDPFNIFCKGKWKELPNRYNDTRVAGNNLTNSHAESPAISHFAGIRTWSLFDIVKQYLYTGTDPRYVVLAGDRRYYKHLVNTAKSLLFHSPVDKIFFLIEDDTFPEPLPDIIQCINISGQKIFPLNGPNIQKHYSVMTTLRAGLSKLFPDIDRILWLDPDMVVTDDISCIWNYDISNYYFAAVQEVRNNNHTKKPYYNAGTLLFNLAKYRADGMDDKVIHVINTKYYLNIEQDVLNFVCDGHIMDLPSIYNSSFVSQECKQPRILHFLSYAKPMLDKAIKPYANLAWENVTYAKGVIHNG